jgi:diadenosine tetraphosphate (Ap4A) HIT family hydrolase
MQCFMCSLDPERIVAENELAAAIRDGFPVSPGHTLVITKRHAENWFDATKNEQSAVLELVDEVKRALDDELHPDGFNIGLNVGEAAGQTVPHLHVHVIPRFKGDVDDPTGGVRLVVPDKGNYRRPGFVPSSSDAD